MNKLTVRDFAKDEPWCYVFWPLLLPLGLFVILWLKLGDLVISFIDWLIDKLY